MQRNRFGCAAARVFVPKGIGEDELCVFPGFKWDFMNAAGEEEEDVFGKEEVH